MKFEDWEGGEKKRMKRRIEAKKRQRRRQWRREKS